MEQGFQEPEDLEEETLMMQPNMPNRPMPGMVPPGMPNMLMPPACRQARDVPQPNLYGVPPSMPTPFVIPGFNQ